MRIVVLDDLEYDQFEGIRDAIYKRLPFSLVNEGYSKKLKRGIFYFWDVSYIPKALLDKAVYPPKTHENVELLHKELEAILK